MNEATIAMLTEARENMRKEHVIISGQIKEAQDAVAEYGVVIADLDALLAPYEAVEPPPAPEPPRPMSEEEYAAAVDPHGLGF